MNSAHIYISLPSVPSNYNSKSDLYH